ncbi:hypothetical protein [Streptomyces sp. 142MFCol3.1]|uniref:hypothetical protein n=1 Tax=Streptomyces sp. 142MFCol3.1 TaxID=1172179 RepID=UPI00048B95C9|nr:hypothetical protein [Streptomyces sp. 142MFCol3.1]
MRSVSLPRRLPDQLAATAALFLPASLSGLDTEDLFAILGMGEDDGLSLAWAPRTGTGQGAVEARRGRQGGTASRPRG